jgi:2'-5' RNA ligase
MPPGDERPLRLFTAIELPSSWKDALTAAAQALAQAAPGYGRWVDPALLHLTLVFLGSQPPARVETIRRALDEAAEKIVPIAIAPGRLGSFGGRGAVRVVWAGIEDEPRGALSRLRDAVAAALRGAGIAFDDTAFRPHITLARARRDAGPAEFTAIQRALETRTDWGAELRAAGGAPHECDEIALIKSDLRPTGPIYTPLHRANLQRRDRTRS